MIIVRYADDVVAGFEHEDNARRFLDAMRERFKEFALSLHPEKTRLIEFGRHAAANREKCGIGKPETFNFLGFTFICAKSRGGNFQVKRKTRRDRMKAKLQEVKWELRRRMHQPIPEQGKWLRQVVTGFFGYHAVPTNFVALEAFRSTLPISGDVSFGDSQKDGFTWKRIDKLADDFSRHRASIILGPAIASPSNTQAGAVCGKPARTDLCGGRPVMDVPTVIPNFAIAGARKGARLVARSAKAPARRGERASARASSRARRRRARFRLDRPFRGSSRIASAACRIGRAYPRACRRASACRCAPARRRHCRAPGWAPARCRSPRESRGKGAGWRIAASFGMHAPVQQLGDVEHVLRRAGHRVDPAELFQLLAGLAEHAQHLAVEAELVDAAGPGVRL